MTTEMWYAIAILSVAIILFITEWIRLDIVALGVVAALVLTGLLSTKEAIAGFSSTSVIMIAALFVLGGAIMQTGLAGAIGRRILTIAGTNQLRLTVIIMLAVALLSAFMSNTGTVAVLMPAIISLAVSAKVSPSKLLIPLAFASSLGGALTLIGTPPNIIVSDVLQENGFVAFGFFEYAKIGGILLVIGVAFMAFIGRRLLPDHPQTQDVQRVDTPEKLLDLYRLPESLFRLRVRRGSELVGKTVNESRLNRDYNLTILEILRANTPRSVMRIGEQELVWHKRNREKIIPQGDTVLALDDILIVQGDGNDVRHAAARLNLGIQPAEAEEQNLITEEAGIAEIVLPPRSSMLGKTITETRFGSTYHLTVLGINRAGATETLDIKSTPLEFGDTLLVQGTWQNILYLRKKRRDFIVLGQPEAMIGTPQRKKAPITLLILGAMLVLMLTKLVSPTLAALLAALAVVLSGALSMDEAYDSIDWKSLVLIAGMLPMATALDKVGLISMIAEGLTNSLGGYGPSAVMVGLFIITAVFTQFISNTATAVLVAPIALVAAQRLGVQPYAFIMAVAMAASMAFASPVASPVNTLVITAGNYRFSDYVKIGVPLTVLMLLVSVLVIPMVFPF